MKRSFFLAFSVQYSVRGLSIESHFQRFKALLHNKNEEERWRHRPTGSTLPERKIKMSNRVSSVDGRDKDSSSGNACVGVRSDLSYGTLSTTGT